MSTREEGINGEVTQALQSLAEGDTAAIDQFLPLVYEQLRLLAASKLRHERPDHTLQPTALVHEVFVRLFGIGSRISWSNRNHFFMAAAGAMRQILIDSARAKKAKKRSLIGHVPRNGSFLDHETMVDPDLLLDLDDLLRELEQEDPDAAGVVKLRLYAGLSTTEASEVLGISRAKAYDNWMFARFWFAERMA